MFDGLIARAPIYTRNLDVYGYELRFCSGEALHEGVPDDEERLGECLLQASRELKLADITGQNRALILLTSPLLPLCIDVRWPREKIVLAVPDSPNGDPVLREAASRLAHEGYTIALHNPSRDPAALNGDADFASICSLDANASSRFLAPSIPGVGPRRLHLLVRELENADQYDHFRRLGFDFFEGDFFSRPRLLHGTEIPANRLGVLQLIAHLQNPSANIQEVEDLVRRDLTLSYKLLRLINSAYFGLPKRVESIRRAVVFYGLQRIKNWAIVLLVNAVDFSPRELLTTAMVRARTCELLAMELGRDPSEPYYLAGLFSLLDAIMDAPMAQILERLNLTEHLNLALLDGSGPIGEVLGTALAFETGDFQKASCLRFGKEFVPMSAYLDAIRWASEVTRLIRSER